MTLFFVIVWIRTAYLPPGRKSVPRVITSWDHKDDPKWPVTLFER